MIDKIEMLEYYTPEQVAEKIQFPVRTIKLKALRGEIDGAQKIFGKWRFKRTEIEKALLNNELK